MIVPDYNKLDIPYLYDFDDNGIPHSYPNTPPGYSDSQILYNFHYEGTFSAQTVTYEWSVNPPFYILSGQSTLSITCQQMPMVTKERENVISGITIMSYSDLNLTITYNNTPIYESLNLYYKKGPYWKIDGNKTPILKYDSTGSTAKLIKSIETYTLIPQYDQTGYPPKYSTNINSYSFDIKNGKVMQFYCTNPPYGYPKVDIMWYSPGPAYLSFYSAWSDYSVKFPNTLDIYVK